MLYLSKIVISRNCNTRKMNIFPILYLLIEVTILRAGTIPPTNYFSTLAEKCSMINSSIVQKAMMEHRLYEKCTEIESIKNITHDNENNARCLLYFDNFVSFCKELRIAKIVDIKFDVLVPDLKNYTVDNFCKNFTLISANKKFEHNISQLISNERICEKLCTTYENAIFTECSLAYYFANFNVTTLIHQEQSISNSSDGLQPHLSNMAQLPKPVDSSDGAPVGASPVKPLGDVPNRNGPLQKGDIPKASKSAQQSVLDNEQIKAPESGKMGVRPSENKAPNLIVKNPTPSQVKDSLSPSTKDIAALATNTKASANEKVNTISASHNKKVDSVGDITDKEEHIGTNPEENGQNQLKPNKEQSEVHKDDIAILDSQDIDVDKAELDDDEADMHDPDIAQIGNIDTVAEKIEKPADEDKGESKSKQEEVADKENQQKQADSMTLDSRAVNGTDDLGESYFFSYFTVICVLFILGYVGYHNRQKVLALVLEGKRGKRQYRGRRPNSANYHKLDSNLEEAISSTCTKNSSHVIY